MTKIVNSYSESSLKKTSVSIKSPVLYSDWDTPLLVNLIISSESFEKILLKAKSEFLTGINSIIPYLNNNLFVWKINKYVFDNVRNISRNPSIDSYNEIYFFLHFFSSRIWTDFFTDGDIYSKNNFENIFNAYVEKIKSIDDISSWDFYSYLDSYTRLCWVLNLICILSQNDNFKIDEIIKLSKLLESKINEISNILEEKENQNVGTMK
jgi:hypothetical protein